MKRVAVVITSHKGAPPFPRETGYWREEVSAFYYTLLDAGAEIVIASQLGGPPPLDAESAEPNRAHNRRFLADPKAQAMLAASVRTADLEAAALDAVYCAGGHGAMWDFPNDGALALVMSEVFSKGGVVATVCHGAAALLNPDLTGELKDLSGRKNTGFSNLEERLIGQMSKVPYALETRLRQTGARYRRGALPFAPFVIRSGRLVTGQNPGSTRPLAQVVASLLGSES